MAWCILTQCVLYYMSNRNLLFRSPSFQSTLSANVADSASDFLKYRLYWHIVPCASNTEGTCIKHCPLCMSSSFFLLDCLLLKSQLTFCTFKLVCCSGGFHVFVECVFSKISFIFKIFVSFLLSTFLIIVFSLTEVIFWTKA